MSMDTDIVQAQEKKLIGQFPNTYTFTKNLAEKFIYQNIGNVKCVIWRPSIILGSHVQPVPGWTDSIAAAGGLTLLAAHGVLRDLYVPDFTNEFDLIPVDMVSNGILIATAN